MFPCPCSRLRIWSSEMGSAVPSRVSLLVSILWLNLVLTHEFPPSFRCGVHLFILTAIRHWVSPEQLRTDGVHCRESAGTVPVVLKVVRVTDAAFAVVTMDQLMCASLFPHPLLVNHYIKITTNERVGKNKVIKL